MQKRKKKLTTKFSLLSLLKVTGANKGWSPKNSKLPNKQR